MTQIKIFAKNYAMPWQNWQEVINQYLKENENTIEVIDIKYTSEVYNPGKPDLCRNWTAMIIYKTK